jgi:hypothetical protein
MEWVLTRPWLLFEAGGEKRRKVTAEVSDRDRNRRGVLICAACRTVITRERARIEINGGHEHSFFNPHGIIFHIGCFSEAPGCRPDGPFSGDFSWFPGYQWQIVHCRNCITHLGWSFRAGIGTPFFGMILNRLTSGEEDS